MDRNDQSVHQCASPTPHHFRYTCQMCSSQITVMMMLKARLADMPGSVSVCLNGVFNDCCDACMSSRADTPTRRLARADVGALNLDTPHATTTRATKAQVASCDIHAATNMPSS